MPSVTVLKESALTYLTGLITALSSTVEDGLAGKVSSSSVKADGTPNAPVKYGASGELTAKAVKVDQVGNASAAIISISANSDQDRAITFYSGTTSKFQLVSKADGSFGLYNFAVSNWAWIVGATNIVEFKQVPTVNGKNLIAEYTPGVLPTLDGSRLTNINAFGTGQSIYNVTSQRSANVVYQNPTDKPMFVSITITAANGSTGSYKLYVGTTSNPTDQVGSVGSGNGSTQNFHVCAMIPPRGYYAFNGGGPAIIIWSEYR